MLENLDRSTRIFIVGMGLTGFSCARFLSGRGDAFGCIDSERTPKMLGAFMEAFPGIDCYTGDEYQKIDFEPSDLLIVSPGIPLFHPIVEQALKQGARLTSDIEIFLDQVVCPIIAITGSNGKSTVVTLIAHILKNANKSVVLAGNIGKPVLGELDDCQRADFAVLELSSFQLERLEKVNADVVSILNVTEDHMDRYDSFEDYRQAKAKIFAGAKACVVNADDPLTKAENISKTLCFGITNKADFYLEKKFGENWIFYQGKALLSVANLKIKGSHNILNVMSGMASCYLAGLDFPEMIDAIESFEGIKHRCQWLGNIHGVNYYNDSKATNVGACLAALEGLSDEKNNIILIAGGQDKNSDFSLLSDAISCYVKQVILIGEDAKKIAEFVHAPVFFADSLESATSLASKSAVQGDHVVLSPACASFDMFDNYQHRGDVFIRCVQKVAEEYV